MRFPPSPAALLVLSSLGLLAVAASVRADTLDDYVRGELEKRHVPGASIAVVRDGKIVKAQGYGMANVELSVPATADTVYEIGSITKQFTATVVMMLVEENKIALDDPIRKHMPDLPAAWDKVTIRHLLSHTSGIKSYTSLPDITTRWRSDTTPAEIVRLVADAPLEFAPGAQWAYSNTGYVLLGMLIEKVAGKPYAEVVAERIFRPLGMTATRAGDFRTIIPNRAAGYTWENDVLGNADFAAMSWPFAAGVLVSTVTDLAKWDAALYTDTLLKKASLQQMWTPTKLADGKTQNYGFGWGVDTFRTRPRVSHGGGIPGFTSMITRFPDDRLTVIVLTNSDNLLADPGSLATGIAERYLPALVENKPKAVADHDPEATALLRGVLQSMAAGTAAPQRFTDEARAALFPGRLQEAKQFLSAQGPLKAFELMESRREGMNRIYAYRAVFGNLPLRVTFVLTTDDKIAGVLVRPEP